MAILHLVGRVGYLNEVLWENTQLYIVPHIIKIILIALPVTRCLGSIGSGAHCLSLGNEYSSHNCDLGIFSCLRCTGCVNGRGTTFNNSTLSQWRNIRVK